jgi:hypothetical protein
VLVHERAHQFGHGECRMRVIELNGVVLAELVDAATVGKMAPENIAHGACHEEVLLYEAQLPARRTRVRWVEHFRNGFRRHLLRHRPQVVAVIEVRHVEIGRRARRVQPQKVHAPAAVTHDRDIGRYADQRLPVKPVGTVLAVPIQVGFDPAVNRHHAVLIAAFDLPRSAVCSPIIRLFALVAVDERLPEQAELIVDAVTVARIGQTRKGIQEAGCEPAQAAVAEGRIGFRLEDVGQIEAHVLGGFGADVVQAEITQVVAEKPADQEFHRQVMDFLRARLVHALCGGVHGANHGLAYRQSKGELVILRSDVE